MPKSNAERCREYRQKKRKEKKKKVPKSSTERVREFRARRKTLLKRQNNNSNVCNYMSSVSNNIVEMKGDTVSSVIIKEELPVESAIQMEVVADVYLHQQQTQQQSQRNIQSTQTRPYSNAERQKRYREKRKADKMNACTTFSQSSDVQQEQPQHDVQINNRRPQSNAERQRKYRKLLREQQQQQQQMEDVNAITVLSNTPHTSSIHQLKNVDPAKHARKQHLNKQRQRRFRARHRFESPSTSSHRAQAKRSALELSEPKINMVEENLIIVDQVENITKITGTVKECRACLKILDASSLGLFKLFQTWFLPWYGVESNVAADLAKLAKIQISETDVHSKLICFNCFENLRNTCEFIASAERSDQILRLRCMRTDGSPAVTWPKLTNLDKILDTPVLKCDVKEEVVSETEMINESMRSNATNVPISGTELVEIKIEPTESLDQINYSGVNGNDFIEMKEEDAVPSVIQENEYPVTMSSLGFRVPVQNTVVENNTPVGHDENNPKVLVNLLNNAGTSQNIIVKKNVECRTCLKIFNVSIGLFDVFQTFFLPWNGTVTTVAAYLTKLAKVQISKTDVFSTYICCNCFGYLRSACEFISIVENSDRILRRRCVETGGSAALTWPKPIALDTILDTSVLDRDIKQEVQNIEEHDNGCLKT